MQSARSRGGIKFPKADDFGGRAHGHQKNNKDRQVWMQSARSRGEGVETYAEIPRERVLCAKDVGLISRSRR